MVVLFLSFFFDVLIIKEHLLIIRELRYHFLVETLCKRKDLIDILSLHFGNVFIFNFSPFTVHNKDEVFLIPEVFFFVVFINNLVIAALICNQIKTYFFCFEV